MDKTAGNTDWFVSARYGMFLHFGLYSIPGRGEWVMNRERISPAEYRRRADSFNPVFFDANQICEIAMESGMKYIVFTTMHHDGFRMYDTALSDFSSAKTAARRDFVYEIVTAARKHGLKIGLYHSLNNWFDAPDAVDALENKDRYEIFIENTFARIKELLARYNPVDIMWYDGWWPFDAEGWKAEEMNEMVRSIQPGIIVNGRNGLPGDFATPEGHITAPKPWRPWEAIITLNDHWGYHAADNNWKRPLDVVKMLAGVANKRGNLMLNIAPDGKGKIPGQSLSVIREVGKWLHGGGSDAVFYTDYFALNLRERGDGRNDWDHNGIFTAKGNDLYLVMMYYPGTRYVLTGLETRAENVSFAGEKLDFSQEDDRLTIALPDKMAKIFCPVIKITCSCPPVIYRTGGMRKTRVAHPHYDPCESDMLS